MLGNWKRLTALFDRHPQGYATLAGSVLLLALTCLNALLGFTSAFYALYVLPIWLATRMGGRLSGFVLVVLSTLITTAAEMRAYRVPGESVSTSLLIRFAAMSALMLLIAQVEQALQKHQRMALRDPLTGLLNRNALKQFAEHAFNRALLRQEPMTVVVIDCDGFKQLNDNHGHQAGDNVLMLLARELERHTRQTDIVARVGGDEFAIVLQETSLDEARQIMCRVDEAFVAQVMADGYSAGLSIGYGTASEGHNELDAVLNLADSSMYQHKQQKKSAAFLR